MRIILLITFNYIQYSIKQQIKITAKLKEEDEEEGNDNYLKVNCNEIK